MNLALVSICFLSILPRTLGVELSLDLDLPKVKGFRARCGVLVCKEYNLSNITSMQVSMTSSDGNVGMKKPLMLTRDEPMMKGSYGGVFANGQLQKDSANLTLDLLKTSDCAAQFLCEVRAVDGQGNKLVHTSSLRQKPPKRSKGSKAVLAALQQQIASLGEAVEVGFDDQHSQLEDFKVLIEDRLHSMMEKMHEKKKVDRLDHMSADSSSCASLHGMEASLDNMDMKVGDMRDHMEKILTWGEQNQQDMKELVKSNEKAIWSTEKSSQQLQLQLAAFLNTTTQASCPAGWNTSAHSGTCIKSYGTPQTWSAARRVCKQQGADLIKIVNDDMNRFVYDTFMRDVQAHFWIGLNDMKVEGKFVWLDELDKPGYEKWAGDQPNNYFNDQHCVAMNTISTEPDTWNDDGCNELHRPLCERRPS